MSLRYKFLQVSIVVLTVFAIAQAEQGILVVHVSDPQHRPIRNVVLSTEGDGSTGSATDAAGKTRIRLAKQTKARSWVSLQVVRSPAGQDLVFISPWNSRARVPSFENESENYVAVVLAQRGDRALLESGEALKAMTANILEKVAPKVVGEKTTEEKRQAALATVSEQFGLQLAEVDAAIRAWSQRAQDPYEKGLAELYKENYPEATIQLSESLQLREKKLEQAQAEVVDVAFFLGQALYGEGRYSEAVKRFQRAATLRENDMEILHYLSLAFVSAGQFDLAEPLIHRLLAILEKALGPEHPYLAPSLHNLAGLYHAKGQYDRAESLYWRALTISEKALGPEDPVVANGLNSLGWLYYDQRQYDRAEPLFQRALAISEKALGLEHPHVAISLNGLAGLYRAQGHYAHAERLYRRALAISEKALGPEHPDVAPTLNGLARLYRAQRHYTQAESLFLRALAIREKALGPEHLRVANSLNNLAGLYRDQGHYAQAEPFYRRALAILEKVLGPEHPYTTHVRKNLEELRRKR